MLCVRDEEEKTDLANPSENKAKVKNPPWNVLLSLTKEIFKCLEFHWRNSVSLQASKHSTPSQELVEFVLPPPELKKKVTPTMIEEASSPEEQYPSHIIEGVLDNLRQEGRTRNNVTRDWWGGGNNRGSRWSPSRQRPPSRILGPRVGRSKIGARRWPRWQTGKE